MQPNDAAVVAQVLAGDREAFGELVQRHSRQIFRVAFRVVGNEEDAEEVVQETFLKAYKRLDRFESRASFSTWVYRIAVNCAIDLRGKRQPGPSLQISEDPEPGEHEIASSNSTFRMLSQVRMRDSGPEGPEMVRRLAAKPYSPGAITSKTKPKPKRHARVQGLPKHKKALGYLRFPLHLRHPPPHADE